MKVLLLGDSITEYLPKDKLNIDNHYNLQKNIQNNCDDYTFYKCGIENYPTEWLMQYVFPRLDTSTHENKPFEKRKYSSMERIASTIGLRNVLKSLAP